MGGAPLRLSARRSLRAPVGRCCCSDGKASPAGRIWGRASRQGSPQPPPQPFSQHQKNWNRGRGDGAEPGLTGAGVRRELCATPNKYYQAARVSVGHSRWQSAGGRLGGAANPQPFPRGRNAVPLPRRLPELPGGSAPAAAPPGTAARPDGAGAARPPGTRGGHRQRPPAQPAGRLRAGNRRPNPALGRHRADPAVAAPGGKTREREPPPRRPRRLPHPHPHPHPGAAARPVPTCGGGGGSGCSGGAWRGASRSAAGAGPGCAAPRCPFPSVENSGL